MIEFPFANLRDEALDAYGNVNWVWARKVAGLTNVELGREREFLLEVTSEEEFVVVVRTRNGGGNRECYCKDDDDCDFTCSCTGCVMKNLPYLPNYLRDEDADYDCTYAFVFFAVLPEFVREVEELYRICPNCFSDYED